MAFTEFYCNFTSGNNLSAGSSNGAPLVSYVGGTFVRATGVFTVATGNPSSDGVAVGDWVSIYTTVGATVANCIALVTARSTTTITIGAAPTFAVGVSTNVSETALAATAVVRGYWKGPNAAVSFPWGSILNTAQATAGNYPRVNFTNGHSYDITANVTHNLAGPVVFQGCTSTAGDGGRFVLQNITTTAAYVLLTASSAYCSYVDMIVDGTTLSSGTTLACNFSGANQVIQRCVFRNLRGNACQSNGGENFIVECEAYACNGSNTAGQGGLQIGGSGMLLRCISHDNVGANSSGFIVDDGRLVDCIADTNGSEGFNITASTLGVSLVNCDAYNNTGDGFDMTGGSSTTVYMENCNAIKNGGWGINSSGSSVRNGVIINCGFGAGTQANTSGTINTNTGAIAVSGTVTYASNAIPYVDAPNGDFRITLSTAKNAGRGAFTQIAGSYAGTIGYPDIGAAQHIDSGGGASSYAFGG